MIRTHKCHFTLLLLVYVISLSTSAASPDLARERQIANTLIDKLDIGEAVWLDEGNRRFLGLFNETFIERRKNAVLLIHGMGAHPDWPDVIAPLRRGLPGNQLPTLSIQMPVLAPEAAVSVYGQTLKEAARRIKIAEDFLHDMGFSHVIIVGYSFGAATSAYYLANQDQHGISAFVSISMLARKFLNPSLKLNLLLEKIAIPVLDIYGSNDLDEVLRAVPDRRLAAHKSGNPIYTQFEIRDSDHIYAQYEQDLIVTIVNWLDQHNQLEDVDVGGGVVNGDENSDDTNE
ncbi:MAG: alpha/beta fold hydrolase [Gammaproteobacteria bacterium]